MTAPEILAFAGLGIAAGLLRGVTGFGGGIVLAAPLSFLVTPQHAVFTTLTLEAFAVAPMIPRAVHDHSSRRILPICLGLCTTVPAGGYLLVTLDPDLLRQFIAGLVLIFSLLLAGGLRYRGTPRTGTSALIGASAGVLTSATSVGGPPIILYLLSGPDPVGVTRANLTLIFVVSSVASLVVLTFSGVVTAPMLLLPLAMAPVYALSVWLGTRIYPYVDERRFRQVSLLALAALAGLLLLL